jgi:hypothetical protein
MDIKLRARLSAYSKISSVEGLNTTLPQPSAEISGAVVGVGDDGQYTLFPTIKKENVDEMFVGLDSPVSVKKDEIDELFKEEDVPTSVTKGEIDKLFEPEEEDDTVSKSDIDELFDEKSSIGTVSFSEIDLLFK